MKNLSILHICNDFSYTKVHKNLYSKLDELQAGSQIIFNPLQKKNNKGKNKICFEDSESEIVYSKLLLKHHRFLFLNKIKFLEPQLFQVLNGKKRVDVIHATTLFSDGALAYKAYKKYKTPYIVTVRNTDINIFLKFRPDLIFLANQIIANASKVLFVSQSNYKLFREHFLVRNVIKDFECKVEVITNAIDDFWLHNRLKNRGNKPTGILFIGRFDTNKNVLTLIEAFKQIAKQYPNLTLNLVGGQGSCHEKVLSNLNNQIKYWGYISDKERLQEMYLSNHIFAMASLKETFGLVYLEAISQGLPILYSKGQGIDGEFHLPVGEACDPKSIVDTREKLLKLIEHYSNYTVNKVDLSSYSWTNVAKKYINIYKEIHA